jgi:hypothetical protein
MPAQLLAILDRHVTVLLRFRHDLKLAAAGFHTGILHPDEMETKIFHRIFNDLTDP